jgi:acetylornithine deacetylase
MATPDVTLEEWLGRLVAHDTVSRNSNLSLLEDAGNWLEDAGFQVASYPNADGTKANLVARRGPEEPGGLMLSAHSDVVPVEGQAWSSDPFVLREAGGRLYGRGTADMKAFIALSLEVARRLSGDTLAVPMWICLSHDEEVGCLGMQELLATFQRQSLPLPAWALIGEPTDGRVCVLHKGMGQLTVRIQGVEGHSSRPDLGVNAIEAAAELLRDFEPIRERLRGAARHTELLELPHSTFSTGWIRGGGDVVNIIPNRCTLSTDFRLAPGGTADEVIEPVARAVEALDRRLKQRDPRAGAALEVNRSYPPLEADPEAPLARLLRGTVADPRPIAVSFATEAAALQRAGVEAVVCGPGSIHQAHRPDESIARDELHPALPWLEGVVRRVCIAGELSRPPR